MTPEQQNFIDTVAPLLQKYAKQYGYHIEVVPAMIAQACQESFYGLSLSSLAYKYHNYWGMKVGTTAYKGKSVNMATKEEYTTGKLTQVRSNFRAYDSMEEGVKGYFEFLEYSNYRACKSCRTPESFIVCVKNGGWATSSSYVANLTAKLDALDLRKYALELEPEEVKPYAARVIASALRVRTGAGTVFPIMQVAGHDFLLPKGTVIAITAHRNNWGKVSDIDGWVSLEYLTR